MTPSAVAVFLELKDSSKAVDTAEVFETEIYMSGMHVGTAG
jgi:hypothetical protein